MDTKSIMDKTLAELTVRDSAKVYLFVVAVAVAMKAAGHYKFLVKKDEA